MSPQQRLFSTDGLHERTIHLKQPNRSASCGRETNEERAFPGKVYLPHVLPGMIQSHTLSTLRIYRLLSGRLMKGARNTGQGQVFRCRGSSGRNRYDMIYMKRSSLSLLRQPAVFATLCGALDD